MKNLKDILTESKSEDYEISLYFDDFDNDFYNVVSEIFFRYNQKDKEPTEEEFDKAVKSFKEKFFVDSDE